MNWSELEQRLEAGTETVSFEVKGAMAWDVRSLAKDFLALSNVRDGGTIVVGVQDQTFVRQGVTEIQRTSFNIDIMRDQLAAYADPHVNFAVSYPKDPQGLTYVVIEIESFREVPVICARDSNDTVKGTIYYRNSDRRVESAPISNSYDMRDLIMVATTRTRRRLRDLGIEISSSQATLREGLDRELGGL